MFLIHILDAISWIERYVENLSYKEFTTNHLVQDGVIRQLEIIGEACRNLSDEFRQTYSDIVWHEMIALRNRLIHAYFNVNLDIIWEGVQNKLPQFKDEIETIVE